MEESPARAIVAESRAARETGGRRNIETHEAKPSSPELKGHTIKEHVGKSENWLRNRLEKDPTMEGHDFASSFRNEAVANRVQGQFVKQNHAAIEAWLKGSDHAFRGKVTMTDPIGIVLERGASKSVETRKALVMIVRDNSPQRWHVLTSYPVIK